MIKGYQAELMDMYEKTRTEENRKLAKRREEIKNKYPEILELDTTIQKLCLNLSMAALKGITDPNDLNNIRDEITDLRAKKYEMLVSHGYSPDYASHILFPDLRNNLLESHLLPLFHFRPDG